MRFPVSFALLVALTVTAVDARRHGSHGVHENAANTDHSVAAAQVIAIAGVTAGAILAL